MTTMAKMRPRDEIENRDDPRGQFALFLRDWVDQHHGGSPKPLSDVLDCDVRAIQRWMKGQNGPAFGDLDRVAKALGYSNWATLAAAVVKHGKAK